MKNLVLIIAVMAICGYSFSQVKVVSNGNVGIATGSTAPAQKLHVVGNTYLNGNLGVGITNPTYKLQVDGTSFFGNTTTLPQCGGLIIEPKIELVYASPFYLYSPVCELYGSGTLRVGKSNNWVGDIYVSKINGYTYNVSSDSKLKENIKPCPSFLSDLKKVKSYNYNYTDEFFKNFIHEQELIERAKKMEYGFLAQEFQKVFPDLVSVSDSTGMLSINYMSMIPILTSAINELQQEIETLKETLALCCNTIQQSSMQGNENNSTLEFNLATLATANVEEMKVYQNAPNPFNERTTIQCYIPQTVKKAELCVYNMQGVQVKCLTVARRGAVDIQIQAEQLSAGVYTYFLIGDGKTSDAKQMILTK